MADLVDTDNDDYESETEAHVRRGLQKKMPAIMNVNDVGDDESETSDGSPMLLGQRFSDEKEENPPPLPGVSVFSQQQYAGLMRPYWEKEKEMEAWNAAEKAKLAVQQKMLEESARNAPWDDGCDDDEAVLKDPEVAERFMKPSSELPFSPIPDVQENLRMLKQYALTGMVSNASNNNDCDHSPSFQIDAVVAAVKDSQTPQPNRKKRQQERKDEMQKKKAAREKERLEKKKAREVAKAAKVQARKAEEQKKEREKKEQAETSKQVDKLVSAFQPEQHKKLIKIQEEKHPRNKSDETDYPVAKWLVVHEGKPNEKKYDLALFNHQQLRTLAAKCNLRGAGSMSMWKARIELATWITSGTIYTNNTIANPLTTSEEKKTNTFLRLINVCFHPSNVQAFLALNDVQQRIDFEKNSGKSPVKSFFVDVSNMCNDPGMNNELSFVCHSDRSKGEDSYDERLADWVDEGLFNLNDFQHQSYNTAQSKVCDLMHCRERALSGMRKSGNGEHDFWRFATNQDFLKWKVSGSPIPSHAVYYVHIMCTQYQGTGGGFDGKFSQVLQENLKSDSNAEMVGSAGSKDSSDSTPSTRKEHKMLKKMDEARDQIREGQEATKEQRQQFIDLHCEQMKEASTRENWKEYTTMSKEFKALKKEEDDDNDILLANMAIRIRALEQAIGIPAENSITDGY